MLDHQYYLCFPPVKSCGLSCNQSQTDSRVSFSSTLTCARELYDLEDHKFISIHVLPTLNAVTHYY